ncbi:sigma-70 family RNA polymerase sigma factor [Rhodocytophaga rosea]|uniref:Sigma-70 family RNA polymerase sigma factor n=1 Tax=Rhodocytophaga rosea TaxID=2704465 RepID=A0A6C0GI92_9BACT|nr:sigma-70 family RNA polymerase sigma factor [Rhodocytophaga rosea]QHT67625.1 sigma-70 family RNA polymerase sigma factor [Rhodocytophaga rosea]
MFTPIEKPAVIPDLFIPENEPEIWRSFTGGNQQAYSYIFVQYKDMLYGYGLTIVSDEEMVCDCIQELFLDLWLRRKNLAQVKTIKYYLLVAFRRQLISKIENRKKQMNLSRQAADFLETTHAESSEAELIHEQILEEGHDKLALSMNHLPKRQKEALYLRYYEKLSYEEIMEVMSLSYKSVRNLVSLAIQVLRKELHKQDFFYSLLLSVFIGI